MFGSVFPPPFSFEPALDDAGGSSLLDLSDTSFCETVGLGNSRSGRRPSPSEFPRRTLEFTKPTVSLNDVSERSRREEPPGSSRADSKENGGGNTLPNTTPPLKTLPLLTGIRHTIGDTRTDISREKTSRSDQGSISYPPPGPKGTGLTKRRLSDTISSPEADGLVITLSLNLKLSFTISMKHRTRRAKHECTVSKRCVNTLNPPHTLSRQKGKTSDST